MEEEKHFVTKEDAEAFGEYKKMKNLLRIKESIACLEMDVSSLALTRAALKSACENAVRLRIHAVRVHSVYVSSAKRFLSGECKVCALVGLGETNEKTLLYECKQAFKEGADEIEVFLSPFYVKNEKTALLKRIVKKIERKKKERGVCYALPNVLSQKEEEALVSVLKRSGASEAFLPFDVARIEEWKKKWELPVKSYARSLEEARLLFAVGAGKIVTDRAEEIAEELLSETENVF